MQWLHSETRKKRRFIWIPFEYINCRHTNLLLRWCASLFLIWPKFHTGNGHKWFKKIPKYKPKFFQIYRKKLHQFPPLGIYSRMTLWLNALINQSTGMQNLERVPWACSTSHELWCYNSIYYTLYVYFMFFMFRYSRIHAVVSPTTHLLSPS